MATGINGVIAAVEVITMDGAEAEATIMDGGTIIAVGNCSMRDGGPCGAKLRAHQHSGRLFSVIRLVRVAHAAGHRAETNSAQRLPIIMAGALVLPALMFGMAERSQTRNALTPRTRNRASSTAIGSPLVPMRHVPLG